MLAFEISKNPPFVAGFFVASSGVIDVAAAGPRKRNRKRYRPRENTTETRFSHENANEPSRLPVVHWP